MKRKILLGEDDLPVRIMVARVLKGAGYEVVLTGSIREVAATVQISRPDLVLLDLNLSDPDGLETFDQIRHAEPFLPVIATTAWSNQQELASQRGMDALIEKPLDLPLLLDLIHRLLAEPEPVRAERRFKGRQLASVRAAA